MQFSVQSLVFATLIPTLLAHQDDEIVTITRWHTVVATDCPNPQSNSFQFPTTGYHNGTATGTGSGVAQPTGSGVKSSVTASSSLFPSHTTTGTSATPTASGCSFWLEDIKHQGIAAFNSDPDSYKVFRNVKDFGAKGDGKTDDTAAINLAISSGDRCAPGACSSSTTSPAIVYFPAGTYIVSDSIIDYYYTQIIGNPNCMPVIKASSSFTARWVIDGDPYQSNGQLGFGATNTFWRQIRNLILDMTDVAPSVLLSGIHWPTAQATSLQNIVFQMSTTDGNQQEGIFIEQGSGGLMADLTFFGGMNGMSVGNQQFTMRNLTFHNAGTAIQQLWDWGWTYKGLSINNCGVGLNMSNIDTSNDINAGAQTVGSVVLIDSDINNTPVAVLMARGPNTAPPAGGSLILENVRLNNVDSAVKGPEGTVLIGSEGESTINAWGQGHSYNPTGFTTFQSSIHATDRPSSLTAGMDYYEQSKPQYETFPASSFVSVRSGGAKGDGVTDDSDVLNKIIAEASQSDKIVFFDAGTYLVEKTVFIPANVHIVGEAYAVIMSSGSFFSSMDSPQPVVKVGVPGQSGRIEWSDMIVSTQGAQAGAILIEYNLASPSSFPSGIWDVHTRVGGFAGSQLQLAECPLTKTTTITAENIDENCITSFLDMHITSSASGLYMENNWLWVADHDVEDPNLTQISIYAGRGLLVESDAGGIWLVGTAVEHHQMYEYQFANTKDIFMGQIQTETAYYQPNPDASIPFPALSAYSDPTFATGELGWGLRVVESSDILVYGAGLYSFFNNNNVTCSNQGNGEACQKRVLSIDDQSTVKVYNLNTVGVTEMATVGGEDLAPFSDNLDGFVDTIALLTVGGL